MVNERELPLHVSGHACQDELKIMHALVRPKFFIPVHGEQRHLKTHAPRVMISGPEITEPSSPDMDTTTTIMPSWARCWRSPSSRR